MDGDVALRCGKAGITGEIVVGTPDLVPGVLLCAVHGRQLEGESPFDNLMQVKS
jgi:hypothetical protein